MRCLIGLSILTVLSAQTTPSHTTDIWKADLSFDQLAQINVTTASRHREELFTTAAAITVVNHSDAHARGATSIPEILRYVPGLNVSQINANTWAIGARGFQWQNANKLLVMIDGRSIYDSVGSGVRWESNAIFLPDLDRIEVVRGPGASTWGANAVNGVINILSRSAFDTLGTSAYIATGNQLQLSAGIRQGLQLSNQSALRVHAMTRLDDDNLLPSGASADDGSRFAQTGFRYDRSFNNTSRLNVIGDAFTQSNEYQRTLASLSAPPPYSFLSDDDIQSQGASLQTNFKTTRDTAHWLEAKAY